jgi:hypothetical protein
MRQVLALVLLLALAASVCAQPVPRVAPPPHPHTLTLALGQEWWLSGVRLTPRQDGNRGGVVTQFRVETSRDGLAWTVAGTTTLLTVPPRTPTDLRFAAVLARLVRVVTMASADSQPWASIAEVQLIAGQAPP